MFSRFLTLTMPNVNLILEALSAVSGCNVESATAGTLSLTPQDFVNVVALKEFYVQEGLLELEYPSLGTLSLKGALALPDAPSAASIPQTTVSVNVNEFLDSRYDYDFTNVKDGEAVFTRGKEQYVRPCGWNRIALKVLNKYRDGDGWLGTGDEAWPVSYHGPAMDGSQGIIRNDGDGDGATVGRGVYSTPDINVAEKFSKRFTSKVDNKTYKVVLRNRINPQKRQQCRRESYWLVYVPEGSSPVQERAIVENSIRPYGLLLKEVL